MSAEKILSGAVYDEGLTFETVPAWTAEDFANSSVPHAWVLEHGGGDTYKTLRYRDMVAAYAKTVGVRNFVSQYNAFEKAQKHGGVARESNATDFSGQPLELLCGEYIANDSVGVVGYNMYHEQVSVCNHPIMPTKRLVSIDTGEVQLELAFRRGEKWQKQVVPRTMLATASQIVGLSAWGIGVDSENAKAMVKFFTELEHLNYGNLPQNFSTSRLGWVADGEFSPYIDGLEFDGDPRGRSMFDAVSCHGQYARWLSFFSEARLNSKIVQIEFAASFASALLEPCNAQPFIVHLFGGTEAGKTVMLLAAISVWGNPSKNAGLFRTFNSTDVGLEMAASISNSIPLFLDELQIEKDKKTFDTLIYKLAEGKGRTRGARAGGLQRTLSWYNTTLSTGEMPITSANSGGGALNRCIEIDCAGEKLFANPRAAVETAQSTYGHAGRHFATLLAKNIDLARALQQDYINQLAKTEATDKQALSASLILAADHLASMWIFGDDTTRLTVDDILPFLYTRADVDINRRAADWLYGWIGEHSNNFFTTSGGTDIGLVYGKIDGDEISIIKKVFDEAMVEAGFNPTVFLQWAAANDVLVRTDAHFSKLVRIRAGAPPVRCIVIKAQKSKQYIDISGEIDEDELPL